MRAPADDRGVRRAPTALLLALLAATAGCGGAATARPAAPAPAAPALKPATLAIEHPGLEPLAASSSNGELRVTAEVAGRATAGELVQVSADCEEPGCSTGARVDGAGRWSARVLVVGDGERRASVRLVAQSGAQVAMGLARLRARRAGDAEDPGSRTRRAAAAITRARTAPAGAATTSHLLVIGDSLAVGMRAALPAALAGWSVVTDGRTGRTLAEGLRAIRSVRSPPPVLAVSLLADDAAPSLRALEEAVRETVALQAGRGCAVWATTAGGRSPERANAVLARLAAEHPRVLRLVPWAQEADSHPEWLAADGVHATAAGLAARAQQYAAAARSCAQGAAARRGGAGAGAPTPSAAEPGNGSPSTTGGTRRTPAA